MNYYLLLTAIICISTSAAVSAQVVEIQTTSPDDVEISVEEEPFVLFGKGLLDVHVNGQIEASAELVKINIGEPTGFNIPLYLLTGATSNTFGNVEENEDTVADLISPTGGFINGFFNGYIPIYQSKSNITKLKLSFLGGGKLVSGKEENKSDISIFGAGYIDAGLLFQTGAWIPKDGNGYVDGGVFWTQVKYSATGASKIGWSSLTLPSSLVPSIRGVWALASAF